MKMGSSFSSEPASGNKTTTTVYNNSTGDNMTNLSATSPTLKQDGFTDQQQPTNLNDLANNINRQQQPATSFANDSTPLVPATNGTRPNLIDETSNDFRVTLFGTHLHPFRWVPTLPTLLSWLDPLSSLAMIIGCVMPYVPQYRTIHRKRNVSGFSTFVCLTLLIANILRIAFWFGRRFETPLLIQSIFMILAQILLLELCVRIKKENALETGAVPKKRSLFNSNLRFFWRWSDLLSYFEFLGFFTLALGLAMYFLIDNVPFVETIGFLALVIESMLGLPQVIKNLRNKSVLGMSLSMVLMWLGGDLFKTGYYLTHGVPSQFVLCGSLQIAIDLLILLQVCIFRENTLRMKRARENSPKEMMAM